MLPCLKVPVYSPGAAPRYTISVLGRGCDESDQRILITKSKQLACPAGDDLEQESLAAAECLQSHDRY
jgi:hypothetical protein